jgi:hypothetical protein
MRDWLKIQRHLRKLGTSMLFMNKNKKADCFANQVAYAVREEKPKTLRTRRFKRIGDMKGAL